jgi:ribosomal-protein-alanine N-acetyltransferase
MLTVNFNPFPSLETERLMLHQLSEIHSESMFRLRGNAQAMQYIGKPALTSEAEALELIEAYERNLREHIGITWGISQRDSFGLIGTIGYHRMDLPNHRAEIGYMLHPDYWAKGIMSEALPNIIKHGFQVIRFHSIEAKISPENEASRKVLLKHGFVKEAYFRESFYQNNTFLDTEIYSLLEQH